MTDFLECLPFSQNRVTRRLICQTIVTVLCILLCLLKDPKYAHNLNMIVGCWLVSPLLVYSLSVLPSLS